MTRHSQDHQSAPTSAQQHDRETCERCNRGLPCERLRAKLDNDTIYLGDNGRALCGRHLGMSARFTGRDLSGQKIMAITPELAALPECADIACETCDLHPNDAAIFAAQLAKADRMTWPEFQTIVVPAPNPKARSDRAAVDVRSR